MIPLIIKEYIQSKTILSSLPKILNLEVTNFCNLECSICVAKNSRDQGFLDLDLLKNIIDANKKVLEGQFIWLHLGGEPLLHPRLSDIIRILKKNRIKARLSTNATLLTEENSTKLMEAGLDYIVFSVDGYNKDTYENIRKGADFEKVEKNILNFLKIKKEKKFNTETQIQIVKIKENNEEIQPFIERWRSTDINYIGVKSFCSRALEVKKIDKFADKFELLKKIKNRLPCFYLWETLVILWNGEVTSCCQDFFGELRVGNVKKESLLQIWNGSVLAGLRRKQLDDDFSMAPCSKCPDWKSLKYRGINIILNKK